MKIACLALDVPLNAHFDYLAAGVGEDDVGRLAVAPFGRRLMTGVVVAVRDTPSVEGVTLKPLKRILRELPPLPQDILRLANFCADYYHHPLGQVLATLLPQRLRRTEPLGRLSEAIYRLTVEGRAANIEALPARAAVKRKVLAALQEVGNWAGPT